VLPEYTGAAIATTSRRWSDRPPTVEQEKLLKEHWVVLTRLRSAGVNLAAVSD
jgi:hypothetical protein